MPRLISLAAGALFAIIPAAGRRACAGDFIGVNHPVGELRLELKSGGAFVLRLSVWDPVVEAFVANRELAGRWRCTMRGIELRAPTRTLWYMRSGARGSDWIWERSTLPTFADGFVLVRGPAEIH
jgi:hypothetical protein